MEPIPSPDGRWIVGMLCRCGHTQTKHGHRLAELPEILVGVPGHGGCLAEGCVCQRFTFRGHIYSEEKEE